MISSEWNTLYIPVEHAICAGTKFSFGTGLLQEKYLVKGAHFTITLFDLNFNHLKRCRSKIISINERNVICEVLNYEDTDTVYMGPVSLSKEVPDYNKVESINVNLWRGN